MGSEHGTSDDSRFANHETTRGSDLLQTAADAALEAIRGALEAQSMGHRVPAAKAGAEAVLGVVADHVETLRDEWQVAAETTEPRLYLEGCSNALNDLLADLRSGLPEATQTDPGDPS